MELHVPDFFNRGPSPVARFALFAGLSLGLLLLDGYLGAMKPLRSALATVIQPVQSAASLPLRFGSVIGNYVADQRVVLADNQRLRLQQLQHGAALLRLAAIEKENQELRALAALPPQSKLTPLRNGLIAEIISVERDPFTRRVQLNRGSNEGVQPGQVAVDASGVIGQITRVLPAYSELTLVTDQNQMVPIQIQRTGLRAVAYGLGREEGLEVRFLSVNTDIRPNDVLVTSGLDGLYPAGLPVARVQKVDRAGAQNFARILCRPLGAPDRFRQVLLLDVPLPAAPAVVAPVPTPGKTH